ncbi:MAG: hypothetical protein WC511_00810 [Candidatus Pacearchaeota archaeon]
MKKIFSLVMILFLIVPLISALNVKIEKTSEGEAMILGVEMPATFNLKITNLGSGNNLMFYNFFGGDTLPKGTVELRSYETKQIAVGVYPRSDMKQEGLMQFDLYIKGSEGESITFPLMVNAMQLEDAFEIGAEEFKPDSNNISVYIKNLVNFNFDNIKINFKSSFFEFEKTTSLAPYEKQIFEINLNKEQYRDLVAGFYTVEAKIQAKEKTANVEGTLKFSEKDIVTSSQNEYGIIVNTKTITKTNEGNVVSSSSTVVKKNIISRLFTTFSPEPDLVERNGLSVYYTWERELKPGEELDISIKTNWLLPLLAVLLIVAVVMLTKQFSKTNLILKKKVNFVRAKGGEFALKVTLIVTARNFVERVNVIDRLPMLAKLHERFGGEMPKKIDEKGRKMEWYFDKLQAGESRIISYIIYSKVGVLGKFVLPTTTAIYEKDGKVHEAESNHAFFITEQAKRPAED